MTKVPTAPASKAIRSKCLDCSAGQPKEVKLCPVTGCPLWPYRFGKRPATVERKNPELLDPEWVRGCGD